MTPKNKKIFTSITLGGSIASLIALVLYFLPTHQPNIEQTSGSQSQVIHAQNSVINIEAGLTQLTNDSSATHSNGSKESIEATLLTPDYMRLFGAIEVPLFMDLFGRNLHFQVNPRFGDNFYSFDRTSDNVVSGKLRDFWLKEWKYSGAHPLQTRLWKQIQGDYNAGVSLYFTSLAPTKADAITFARTIDEGSGEFVGAALDSLHVSFDSARDQYSETGSGQIGFLFLILSNTTKQTLVDIEISFYEYPNKLKIKDWIWADSSNLFKLNWPDPRLLALTDTGIQETADPIESSVKIASASLGESFIWLISIYRADTDGLPLFYLTDVQIPREIYGLINGTKRRQHLRKPYLLQAARVIVPYGWFGQ
jgi:hypothetical protein